jgi:hypothetical protein
MISVPGSISQMTSSLLAGRVVLDRDERDEVLQDPAVDVCLRVTSDVRDDPDAPANAGELAGLGSSDERGGCGLECRHHALHGARRPARISGGET